MKQEKQEFFAMQRPDRSTTYPPEEVRSWSHEKKSLVIGATMMRDLAEKETLRDNLRQELSSVPHFILVACAGSALLQLYFPLQDELRRIIEGVPLLSIIVSAGVSAWTAIRIGERIYKTRIAAKALAASAKAEGVDIDSISSMWVYTCLVRNPQQPGTPGIVGQEKSEGEGA